MRVRGGCSPKMTVRLSQTSGCEPRGPIFTVPGIANAVARVDISIHFHLKAAKVTKHVRVQGVHVYVQTNSVHMSE